MKIDMRKFKSSKDYAEAKTAFQNGDRMKAASIVAKYDVVDPRKDNGQRRKAEIEHHTEEKLLRPYDRLKLINLLRDAERNASLFRGMMLQLRLNAAGDIKIQVNTNDAQFNEDAAFFFNSVFAKNCDFMGDLHLAEFCQNIVASRFREGDCLIVFDPLREDSAKLLAFEADQFVNLEKSALAKMRDLYSWIPADASCESGVILDRYGRPVGYAVSREHGLVSAEEGKVSLFSTEEAKLLKRNWRFGQVRGVPDFAAGIADVEDSYEMRTKELQSAKLAASLVLVVKSQSVQDAIVAAASSPELDKFFADGETPAGEDGAASIGHMDGNEEKEYEEFGNLTGGMIERLGKDDVMEELNSNRPNLNADAFYKTVNQSAGAGIGLGKCYSSMEVDSSYTAFRGEMVMSWRMFRDLQKWLERHFLDWLAGKVFGYAERRMLLPPCSDPFWRHKISWSFPSMPSVDPDKEASAHEKNLRNGLEDYSEILGPQWRTKFAALSEQLDTARKSKIPLSVLSTVAGAVIEDKATEGDTDDTVTD